VAVEPALRNAGILLVSLHERAPLFCHRAAISSIEFWLADRCWATAEMQWPPGASLFQGARGAMTALRTGQPLGDSQKPHLRRRYPTRADSLFFFSFDRERFTNQEPNIVRDWGGGHVRACDD